MKRKINRVGTSTLTVSLPAKWAKMVNLGPGDEIELHEQGHNLIISKDFKPEIMSNFVDVSGHSTMIHRIIAAIYKAGYDETTIKYGDSKELQIIQDRIERNLTGFDAVDYKDDKIIIKSISELNPDQFESMFKRSFFSLQDSAHDCVKALKNNDYDLLKNIVIRDKNIDRTTDFCRRLLNKGIKDNFKKPLTMYYIIEEIEIIGDMYKDLSQYVVDKHIKVNKSFIELLEEINSFSDLFINMIFKFDFEKMKEFGKERVRLNNKIDDLFDRLDKKDMRVFFYIVQIFNATFEMKSALITENV